MPSRWKDLDLAVGDTKFLPASLPALADGEYTVEVQQVVTSPESKPLASASTTFWVQGPRFALNPADVFSQHPPPGHVGAFGNELPHIVLRRKTLPWERRMDGTAARPNASADDPIPAPWLGLLTVDAKDSTSENSGAPKVRSGTLGDLLPSAQGGCLPEGVLGPTLPNIPDTSSPLNPWESVDDPCTYLDLDAALYTKIIPALDELHLLAHVREINTGDTVIDDMKADGSYAVLVANRLPYSESHHPPVTGLGVENTVCLVSLEGFQSHLYDYKTYSAHLPEGIHTVRLAVLSHWSFWDNGGDNVQEMLERLDVGPLNRSGKPYLGDWSPNDHVPTPEDPGDSFSSFVDYALAQGYTALNHRTRVGEKTVSWFRGPLRPFPTETAEAELFHSSDAALRYSPDSGMFDVSYAAAWQLGRLLALHSKQLALAVYNYRSASYQSYQRRIAARALRRRAAPALAAENPHRFGPRGRTIREDFLRWLSRGELYRVVPPGPRSVATPPSAEPGPGHEADSPGVADTDLAADLRAVLDEAEVPEVIARWLGRLCLLYGVPLQYLVPDAAMLPQESFRYFHYDSIWIECLLDGALSIGRPTEENVVRKLLEEALAGDFKDRAAAEAFGVRGRLLQKKGLAVPEARLDALPQAGPADFTGFLMRSSLVPGWKGLEITAYPSTDPEQLGDPLRPLRIDRIAPDVLFCVYPGQVNQVVVRQPPQGIQFGAEGDPRKSWYKEDLRYLSGDQTGQAFSCKDHFAIAARDTDPRVLNVAQIAHALSQVEEIGLEGTLNSADFAVEMVLAAAHVIFTPHPPGSKP